MSEGTPVDRRGSASAPTAGATADADGEVDVAVIGGGPAGCSAGVFCAREGLTTVIFDRGRSSIARCAHLENYPGFPAGIDVGTFTDLLHDHAETAGCTIRPHHVESVRPAPDGATGFVVEPQHADPIGARRVVAATRYDGEYLRGLDDDAALFETTTHDGEETEYFDREYADPDGRTPVDGLYVASPSTASHQAVEAAGRGARTARSLLADARLADGWWPAVAEDVDWTRRVAELDGEDVDERDWEAWFDDRRAEAAPVDTDTERYRRVRAAAVERMRESHLAEDAAAERASRGHRALAAHLDPEAVAEALGPEPIVDAVGPEAIVDALDERRLLAAMDEATIAGYLEETDRSVGREAP